jgi:YbgC/YbaW family acyl-CoA thioester hydrolase
MMPALPERARHDRAQYRHEFRYRVRSHECDRQGVVHNAKYLEMLEVARIEYCRDVLHIPIDAGTFAEHHKFFFVRNAMDYYSPAVFDEPLVILTRVAKLGKSSVTIEQIVESERDGRRILEAEAVMVSVDERTDRPIDLDPELRARAEEWEGSRGSR